MRGPMAQLMQHAQRMQEDQMRQQQQKQQAGFTPKQNLLQ